MVHYIAPPPCAPSAREHYVHETARRWMQDPRTVLLDTETTDLDGWPIEVAVIDTSGRVLLDTLAMPPVPVAPAARAVHGITDADLQHAPSMREALHALAAVLVGRRVLAYNAAFDREVLTRAYTRTIQALPVWHSWGCVMELESWKVGAYRDDGRVRAVPLEAVEHRALGDCRAALAVLHRLSEGDPA